MDGGGRPGVFGGTTFVVGFCLVVRVVCCIFGVLAARTGILGVLAARTGILGVLAARTDIFGVFAAFQRFRRACLVFCAVIGVLVGIVGRDGRSGGVESDNLASTTTPL